MTTEHLTCITAATADQHNHETKQQQTFLLIHRIT